MAQNRSADEVREHNIATMGSDLGELFTALSTELTWLHWKWSQFVKLYAEKESRLDVLNRAAPFFFWVVQDTLWHETLLGISRLCAHPSSTGKPNLTIRRLPPLLDPGPLKDEVDAQIRDTLAFISFADDWRHRHIAHRDLALALGQPAEPLAQATKSLVDQALSSLANVLNCIELDFSGSTTAYNITLTTGDAESLLYVLRDGLIREDIRRRNLQAGIYNREEWNDDLGAV